ncbi:MAG: PilN domain-containing protein [Proteobacteria bacterium]|nr:PilN domain-containing protein [Burkholderiales bacterium]
MARFEIDFSRSRARTRTRSLMLLAAGAVAAAIGIWSLTVVDDERTTIRDQRTKLREASRPRSQGPAGEATMTPERQREVVQANRVAGRLNLRWSGLLDALESSANASVFLLAMTPDPQDGTVRLTGEAKTLPVILDYLQLLQQQPVLAEVRLESHETLAQDPQRPVRFVVAASWRVKP